MTILLIYVANVRLLGGVVCYVAVMVLFVAAFKRGGALTVLYPIYASTFIGSGMISADGSATPTYPQCGACHGNGEESVGQRWLKSRHAPTSDSR